MGVIKDRPAEGKIAFTSFGCAIGVEANDPMVFDRLPDYLPYGWRAVPHSDLDRTYAVTCEQEDGMTREYAVHCGEENVFSGGIEETLDALERDIRLFLVDHARDWVFVHAGVVGWHGRAIVIPARSGAGKSSLTVELVQAGARYYSDEFAVLDASGRIHPFATPIQVRARPGMRQHRRALSEVGGVAGTEPIPIGIVAAVVFRPNSVERLEDLTPGRGILALLEHVPLGPQPDRTLAVLEHAVVGARIVTGERGEAKPFAQRLLGLLDAETETM